MKGGRITALSVSPRGNDSIETPMVIAIVCVGAISLLVFAALATAYLIWRNHRKHKLSLPQVNQVQNPSTAQRRPQVHYKKVHGFKVTPTKPSTARLNTCTTHLANATASDRDHTVAITADVHTDGVLVSQPVQESLEGNPENAWILFSSKQGTCMSIY